MHEIVVGFLATVFWRVLAIIGLSIGALASCVSQPGSIFGDGVEYSDGYDPAAVEAQWRLEAQTHRTDASYSLSGNGRVSSSLILGSPRNSVFLKNFETGIVLQFALPQMDAVLLDPEISDDAAKIAVVRSKIDAPYTFLSDIIIINTKGEIIDTISECNGLYRQPAFSPDGKKIAYFKYANNGIPSDIPIERGGKFSTVWLPFEFDLETREERQLVDLAWAASGWIEYVENASAFAVRAFDVQFFEDKETFSGVRYRRWRGKGGNSVLDQLSDTNRLNLLAPQIVSIVPSAAETNEQISAALKSRSIFIVSGASSLDYIATRRSPEAAGMFELLLLDSNFDIRTVVSRAAPFVHEAAISRDGCVIMEGRRPRGSKDVTTTIWNICGGTSFSYPEQIQTQSEVIQIVGETPNDCGDN